MQNKCPTARHRTWKSCSFPLTGRPSLGGAGGVAGGGGRCQLPWLFTVNTSCPQSLTDRHTSNTPCVSPELLTKLTARTLTGSWRRSLTATTPAQSSSTCCSASYPPTACSKWGTWTVWGEVDTTRSDGVRLICVFLALTRRTFWWRPSTTSSLSQINCNTNWGGAPATTTTNSNADLRKISNYLNLLLLDLMSLNCCDNLLSLFYLWISFNYLYRGCTPVLQSHKYRNFLFLFFFIFHVG